MSSGASAFGQVGAACFGIAGTSLFAWYGPG
jgi:hypothetical protein